MNIKRGDKLWFKNKHTNAVEFIVVISSDSESFSFRYNGKIYNVSKSYADGKLYRHANDIPFSSFHYESSGIKNSFATVRCSNKGSTLCKPEHCVCEYLKSIPNYGSEPRGASLIGIEDEDSYGRIKFK